MDMTEENTTDELIAAASPPPPNRPYDHLFKILVVGDSGVGKSCILLRYTDNTFTEMFISTIGVDFKLKTMQIADKVVKLQIWDTAGQERFKSITSSYFRGANGILICFDVTEPETFEHVQRWLDDSKRLATSQIPIVIVGNKVDLRKRRAVTAAKAKALADKFGLPFIETSAKTGFGVEKAFQTLVAQILNKKVPPKPTPLLTSPRTTPMSKCCS